MRILLSFTTTISVVYQMITMKHNDYCEARWVWWSKFCDYYPMKHNDYYKTRKLSHAKFCALLFKCLLWHTTDTKHTINYTRRLQKWCCFIFLVVVYILCHNRHQETTKVEYYFNITKLSLHCKRNLWRMALCGHKAYKYCAMTKFRWCPYVIIINSLFSIIFLCDIKFSCIFVSSRLTMLA